MKKDPDRVRRDTADGKNQCVRSSCEEVGANAEEQRQMLRLLGKVAPKHEIAANLRGRPPKFR